MGTRVSGPHGSACASRAKPNSKISVPLIQLASRRHVLARTHADRTATAKLVPKPRKVDVRPPGKRNSNSHGARPVYQNHLDDYVDSDQ